MKVKVENCIHGLPWICCAWCSPRRTVQEESYRVAFLKEDDTGEQKWVRFRKTRKVVRW